ncbi:hypothetical protein CISG_07808 [Coccidioides immitis RMSCC 3703]|uniref:Uncharacterized protein n=1 Tax=Coccidioides immitis RMSCC 3703 TaxID=454286 RepID=A0A0J8R2M1_COCIT|nr:hypothetical protein CISG_07808 [Coccidioides immitis RMSCC 3703]
MPLIPSCLMLGGHQHSGDLKQSTWARAEVGFCKKLGLPYLRGRTVRAAWPLAGENQGGNILGSGSGKMSSSRKKTKQSQERERKEEEMEPGGIAVAWGLRVRRHDRDSAVALW